MDLGILWSLWRPQDSKIYKYELVPSWQIRKSRASTTARSTRGSGAQGGHRGQVVRREGALPGGGYALGQLGAVLDAQHHGCHARHAEGVAVGEDRRRLAEFGGQLAERFG